MRRAALGAAAMMALVARMVMPTGLPSHSTWIPPSSSGMAVPGVVEAVRQRRRRRRLRRLLRGDELAQVGEDRGRGCPGAPRSRWRAASAAAATAGRRPPRPGEVAAAALPQLLVAGHVRLGDAAAADEGESDLSGHARLPPWGRRSGDGGDALRDRRGGVLRILLVLDHARRPGRAPPRRSRPAASAGIPRFPAPTTTSCGRRARSKVKSFTCTP